MNNIIIGTAGHVDHGKTALIHALTGYDGDETKEEKQRGITINLSFSNLKNDYTNIAFIDVPGHEKLIKNMISGAFGFDYVLLVIAANEGIMPQTKEHVEILSLLGIKNIIIVLSKIDLVDKDTLVKCKQEIKSFFKQFDFTIASTHLISIFDTKSIEDLKMKLLNLPQNQKQQEYFFRFYIDRIFSPKGIGTVVTGTVLGQEIEINEKVFICDIQKETRIKNIQIHNKNQTKAYISNRAALNLHNINNKELQHGFLISKKGILRGFKSIDIYFKCLNGQVLHHNRQYSCYIGSKKIEAKILLYDLLNSQSKGFANLSTKIKLYTIFKEKFIIRDDKQTIAGGFVLNPINDPMKKKQKKILLKSLYIDDFEETYNLLLDVHKKGLGIISSIQRFSLSHKEALFIANGLDNIFVDEKSLIIYPLETKSIIKNFIQNIYIKNKYAFLSLSTINLRLTWASECFIQLVFDELVNEDKIEQKNKLYKKKYVNKDFLLQIEDKVCKQLEQEGLTPTAPYNIYDALDLDRKLGDTILKTLTTKKKIKRLQHNLFIHTKNLQKILNDMRKIIKNDGFITIQSFKIHYPISRKYLIAYLDYLDQFDDIQKEDKKRFFH